MNFRFVIAIAAWGIVTAGCRPVVRAPQMTKARSDSAFRELDRASTDEKTSTRPSLDSATIKVTAPPTLRNFAAALPTGPRIHTVDIDGEYAGGNDDSLEATA